MLGAHAHQVRGHHVDARFLRDLANHGVCRLLARLVDAVDERPLPRIGTPTQKHATLAVLHIGSHTDKPQQVVTNLLAQTQDELGSSHDLLVP